MGASAESRRAGDRERRLLREVDPELAAIKDQEELEPVRRQAISERKARGMPQIDPLAKQVQKENDQLAMGCLFWLLAVVGVIWVIVANS